MRPEQARDIVGFGVAAFYARLLICCSYEKKRIHTFEIQTAFPP